MFPSFQKVKSDFPDPDHFSNNSLIMLLDVGLDANREDDIVWLKQLLDTVLPEIGETDYFLTPYTPEN